MSKKMLIAAAAFLISGCVSQLVETNPPKPRYIVNAVDAAALAGATVDWSLIVEDPKASRAYDTTKVVVSRAPGRIEYFDDGEWAARAPRMFQTALLESFEDSGRILAIGDRVSVPVADYVLQTDIRRIEINIVGGERRTTLSVYARLTNGKGKVYAARAFSAAKPVASSTGDDVAAAFNASFQEVIAEIVRWSFEQGEKVEAAGRVAS